MDNKKYETLSDKEIIEQLVSNDGKFIDYFFYQKCNPLIFKISSKILNGAASSEDLRQELTATLCANDWKVLREFKYNSTLMGWIKVICVNLAIKLRQKDDRANLKAGYQSVSDKLSKIDPDKLSEYLQYVSNPVYKMLLREKYVLGETAEDICNTLDITLDEFKNVIRQAEKTLFNIVKSKEISTNRTEGIAINNREEFKDCYNIESKLTARIDINALLNYMPNDRYRYVLDSIMIQGKSIEELAKELNIKKSNVSNIKHRALVQLAQICRGEKIL